MGSLGILVALGALACSGGGNPEIVLGGGVAGPTLDGTLHVFVVDEHGDARVAGARVWVGPSAAPVVEGTTDASGLATLVSPALAGAITVSASASGRIATSFAGVVHESATIPLTSTAGVAPGMVTGTIAGFDEEAPAAGHYRVAAVDVTRPADGVAFAARVGLDEGLPHVCIRRETPSSCAFALDVVPGEHTPFATIIDVEEGPSPLIGDEVLTVVRFVRGAPITVASGATISDVRLDTSFDPVALTVDIRGLPPGLAGVVGVPGVRAGPDDEVMLVPIGTITTDGTAWVPPLTGDLASGSYWLIGRATNWDGSLSSTRLGRGVTDVSAPVMLDGWALPPVVSPATDALGIATTEGAAYRQARFGTPRETTWRVLLFGAADRIAFDVSEDARGLAGANVDITAVLGPSDGSGTSLRVARDGMTAASSTSIVLP